MAVGGISSSFVELGKGAYFSGNRAGNNDSASRDSQGGAIYLFGRGASTATLNADDGDIAFKGNYVNVSTAPSTSTANSIHLDKKHPTKTGRRWQYLL